MYYVHVGDSADSLQQVMFPEKEALPPVRCVLPPAALRRKRLRAKMEEEGEAGEENQTVVGYWGNCNTIAHTKYICWMKFLLGAQFLAWGCIARGIRSVCCYSDVNYIYSMQLNPCFQHIAQGQTEERKRPSVSDVRLYTRKATKRLRLLSEPFGTCNQKLCHIRNYRYICQLFL